jgi:ATP-binding protein involved in chromosome partitioning
MAADHHSETEEDLATGVRQALAAAAIGRDVTLVDLSEAGGIGEISVTGETATVTVTLPIPAPDVRARMRAEIRRTALDVEGVSAVDCRFEPSAADSGARVEVIPQVKNVIAVGSGKGGVGKSTIASNLAVSLAATGADVGLLDADVYGPNAPAMLGLSDHKPAATLDDRMVPREGHGVKAMSMGFVVEEEDPVIWRGPIVDEFIKQLFGDVEWGALDYLVIDLPPGTGDAQLSLVQHLPVTGAVIVTTPQALAVDDAKRGLRGFARYDVPILGIIENMSGFTCPDCGSDHDIFDTGGAEELGAEFDVPVLGRVPLDPVLGAVTASEDETSDPPGVSIPGLGRLQLPQLREEREQADSLDPITIREDGGDTRGAIELLATRTAARINSINVSDMG